MVQVRRRALAVAGPFALPRALAWLNGFPPATLPRQAEEYAAAHVLNDQPRPIRLAELAAGRLRLTVEGEDVAPADLDAAEVLVRRLFSLDRDADDFYARVGAADPVLGALQQRFAGLRPVLFATPFEAAVGALLAIRTAMAGAAGAKRRLTALSGPTVEVAGVEWRAFPPPAALAATDPRDLAVGIPRPRIPWLLGLAARASTGAFDAEHLHALGAEAAGAWLRQSTGIGPWASTFVLVRGVGYPDVLPFEEGRLFDAVRHYYDLGHTPGQAELERLADAWAGWRSWAAFLLRSAYQADTGAPTNPRARQR